MADSSFDVVSEYDRQEVDNAVNQTAKEISQRYDFKGVGASVVLAGETITMAASASWPSTTSCRRSSSAAEYP